MNAHQKLIKTVAEEIDEAVKKAWGLTPENEHEFEAAFVERIPRLFATYFYDTTHHAAARLPAMVRAGDLRLSLN